MGIQTTCAGEGGEKVDQARQLGPVGVEGRGIWGVSGPAVKVNQTAEVTGHLGVYPAENEELRGSRMGWELHWDPLS